jgi:DNA-binding transcriptional regulator YiaG
LYKMRTREKAISRAKLETEIERTPVAYITEEQVKAIQDKEWLDLKEAAFLLNVSPLTLRRWTNNCVIDTIPDKKIKKINIH